MNNSFANIQKKPRFQAKDASFALSDVALMSRIVQQSTHQQAIDGYFYIPFKGSIYQAVEIMDGNQYPIILKDSYEGDKLKDPALNPLEIYNRLFERLGEMGYIEKYATRVQGQAQPDGGTVLSLKLNGDDIAGIKRALAQCRHMDEYPADSYLR